jgi:hypothetical protein
MHSAAQRRAGGAGVNPSTTAPLASWQMLSTLGPGSDSNCQCRLRRCMAGTHIPPSASYTLTLPLCAPPASCPCPGLHSLVKLSIILAPLHG